MGAERGIAAGQNKTGYAAVSGHILFCIFRIMEDWWEQAAFLELRLRCRDAWGPTNAFGGTIHWMVPSLCLFTFPGETLRVPVSTGASRTRPVPFCREHSVQFTAVLIFAICVQAQPALLKKAGENFTFCSPLALCLPLEPILIPNFIQIIAADPSHTYRPAQSGSIRCRPRVRLRCSP